ncbi:hypothetical protein ACPC54_30490 [Kitasatospora sp. NPDC094028]
MDDAAAAMTAVWGIGIVLLTLAAPVAVRRTPSLALAVDFRPVPALLLLAILIVFWPVAVTAHLLPGGADRTRPPRT